MQSSWRQQVPRSNQPNNSNGFFKNIALECIHGKGNGSFLLRIQPFSKICIVFEAPSNIILYNILTNIDANEDCYNQHISLSLSNCHTMSHAASSRGFPLSIVSSFANSDFLSVICDKIANRFRMDEIRTLQIEIQKTYPTAKQI